MSALARALQEKLATRADSLFKSRDNLPSLSHVQVTNTIAAKLDILAKGLELNPFNKHGHLVHKLQPISQEDIQPALVICSQAMECEQPSCDKGSLRQETRDRDVPRVTLIKGTEIISKVQVLVGKCSSCKTNYYGDHHRVLKNARTDTWDKAYLNSAQYLKIGQTVWCDRFFSNAVLNGIYNFHASASAYAQFWNDSFWEKQQVKGSKISRRQVWQAFVQESLRKMAQLSEVNLLLPDALPIDQVTKQAFLILGAKGVIRNADNHQCSECTHEYKSVADTIEQQDLSQDPAALLGVDEHQEVPALIGEDAALVAHDAIVGREASIGAETQEDVDMHGSDEASDEWAPVKMVILDGIVMGHTVCIILFFVCFLMLRLCFC